MLRKLLFVLLAAACLISAGARAAPPAVQPAATGAAYIRLDDSWRGFWPHGAEFVAYTVSLDAQPQDAFHVMLKPGLGMMLTFADKKNFGAAKNMLEAHREWELNYWRKNAGTLNSKNREDLAGGRSDLLVTEIVLPQADGPGLTAYMIGVAGSNGVFVFSISPVGAEDNDMVKKLIASIRVEHKKLDLKAEAKKVAP
ncbi:MAG TPA: hypothetical protein VIU46_03240 [Gallionellaceae bacterium]